MIKRKLINDLIKAKGVFEKKMLLKKQIIGLLKVIHANCRFVCLICGKKCSNTAIRFSCCLNLYFFDISSYLELFPTGCPLNKNTLLPRDLGCPKLLTLYSPCSP